VARRAARLVNLTQRVQRLSVGGDIVRGGIRALVHEPVVIGRVRVYPHGQPQPVLPGQAQLRRMGVVTDGRHQFALVRAIGEGGRDAGVLHARGGESHQMVCENGLECAVVAVVRDLFIVRNETSGKVQSACGLKPGMAPDTVLVQHRLNVAQKTDGPVAPGRGYQSGRLARQRSHRLARGQCRLGRAGFVATGAAARFARLKTDERTHAPQFAAVLVEELEIHGRVGGHDEVGASVRGYRHIAEDPYGCPIG